MDSSYVFIILLLAPGFLACAVSTQFDNKVFQENKIDVLVRYFIYSFFIFFLVMLVSVFIGIISWNSKTTASYQYFIEQVTVGNFIEFLLLIMIISILVGSIWPRILRTTIRLINRIRLKMGFNLIPTKPDLLEEYFDDNEQHFIVIEKQGKFTAMGLYAGVIFMNSGRTEIAVRFYPEYIKLFDILAHNSIDKVALTACKGIYTILESDIIIREYDIGKLEVIYKSISNEQDNDLKNDREF